MSFTRIAPEQFDTLPDIPEPAENPLLVGHEEAACLLAGAHAAGKLHHALLIAGPTGIGKATLAFHLAHHLLAHPDPADAPATLVRPDPSSQLHRLIAQGAHPSVLHLTRPMNEKTKAFKTVVTVDEIRRVNRFLSMTSHDGAYRIVIVDPADDMNTNAANALLKSLEEPPPRTLFILIAHSLGRLLPTIRSRCQVIKLKPLEPREVIAVLETMEAGVPADAEGKAALAARAGGSVRDALLLTQYGGLEITEAIEQVVDAAMFDATAAYRIADAVAGRDGTVQFQIFNQTVLDMVSARAGTAGKTGHLDAAVKFSDLWGDMNQAVIETETYNLDKKQHVVGLLRRMCESFRD
ncbi:DNA polymerase III subunit delta' [Aquamicrobium sp. LC103]|uniref:DNA polymerase III subunit delta' n=1 Tax=Aquamicrobium sp. LC103 TaxID=1120658 RepID=UPI00063E7CDB|nr:DNA polymerase III subunit delta' [Aquamicrobium sp. LC103]TKT79346.1 DNA polymerase III subunit delta' [Aquamicrobium sp. LC103]